MGFGFEKRNSPRFPTVAEMRFEHLGHPCPGRLTDVSLGGFFVDTIHPLPAGSRIGFEFGLSGQDPENPIKGEAEVVWQQPLQGMGARFTWVSVTDQNRLISFLSHKLAV